MFKLECSSIIWISLNVVSPSIRTHDVLLLFHSKFWDAIFEIPFNNKIFIERAPYRCCYLQNRLAFFTREDSSVSFHLTKLLFSWVQGVMQSAGKPSSFLTSLSNSNKCCSSCCGTFSRMKSANRIRYSTLSPQCPRAEAIWVATCSGVAGPKYSELSGVAAYTITLKLCDGFSLHLKRIRRSS